MSEEPNPFDHLSEGGVPDEESSLKGTTSPVGGEIYQENSGVVDPVIAAIERKITDLTLDVTHLNRVNIELLMTDMHELADELGRLQTNLSSIYTPEDIKEIEYLKRYRSPNAALKRIELMHSEDGRIAREGMSSITAIKNLMNRFQEKLRKLDNDNLS